MIYIIGKGFLGLTLAEYFADHGRDMTVVGREDPTPSFHEADTIINCAASGYRRGQYGTTQTVTDNYYLPVLLDKVRRGANLIQFGSWTEECAPHSDYSHSKALATSYLEGKAHICMTSSVWGGPHESKEKFMGTFLRACANNEPYVVTHPFRRRDFVHIDTFCPAVDALTKHRDYKKRYFATGKLTSFWQIYVLLRDIAGREFPNVHFVDDVSANYDWRPDSPEFDDTLKEDIEREWRKLCG